MKRFSLFLLSTLALPSVLFFSAAPALAQSDSYRIDVAGLQNGMPFAGEQGIDFTGKNKPKVSIAIIPNTSQSPFSYYELYIDSSRKSQWNSSGDSQSFVYSWDLCAAGTSQGRHVISFKGKDAFGTMQDAATSVSMWVHNFSQANNCGDPNTGTDKNDLSISVRRGTTNTNWYVATLISDIQPATLCSTYVVRLMLTPPTGPDVDKGTFCGAGQATIREVTWDASQSTPGSYILRAVALHQNGGSTIASPQQNVQIVSSTGGTGTGGSGTGTGAGAGSTPSRTSPTISPLKFDVPDLSTLKGKKGDALRVALLETIIDLIIFIVSILATIAFLYSGIMYGLSFGDPTKSEKAKKNLQWAIMGMIIAFLSVTILAAISRLLNTSLG